MPVELVIEGADAEADVPTFVVGRGARLDIGLRIKKAESSPESARVRLTSRPLWLPSPRSTRQTDASVELKKDGDDLVATSTVALRDLGMTAGASSLRARVIEVEVEVGGERPRARAVVFRSVEAWIARALSVVALCIFAVGSTALADVGTFPVVTQLGSGGFLSVAVLWMLKKWWATRLSGRLPFFGIAHSAVHSSFVLSGIVLAVFVIPGLVWVQLDNRTARAIDAYLGAAKVEVPGRSTVVAMRFLLSDDALVSRLAETPFDSFCVGGDPGLVHRATRRCASSTRTMDNLLAELVRLPHVVLECDGAVVSLPPGTWSECPGMETGGTCNIRVLDDECAPRDDTEIVRAPLTLAPAADVERCGEPLEGSVAYAVGAGTDAESLVRTLADDLAHGSSICVRAPLQTAAKWTAPGGAADATIRTIETKTTERPGHVTLPARSAVELELEDHGEIECRHARARRFDLHPLGVSSVGLRRLVARDPDGGTGSYQAFDGSMREGAWLCLAAGATVGSAEVELDSDVSAGATLTFAAGTTPGRLAIGTSVVTCRAPADRPVRFVARVAESSRDVTGLTRTSSDGRWESQWTGTGPLVWSCEPERADDAASFRLNARPAALVDGAHVVRAAETASGPPLCLFEEETGRSCPAAVQRRYRQSSPRDICRFRVTSHAACPEGVWEGCRC